MLSFILYNTENRTQFTLKGLSEVLPTLKGENKAFPPDYPPCNVVLLFELPLENNNNFVADCSWYRGDGTPGLVLFE